LVREPQDGNLCPAEGKIEPIGVNADQNETEPKEKPPVQGVLPLVFFHWRSCMKGEASAS